MENLKLWNKVCKTNPTYTKKANVRGNSITAIAPQYQILQATEQWGAYGTTWGFSDFEIYTDLMDKGLVYGKGDFFYPGGRFQITASIGLYRDNAMTKVDQDFAKKLETDTLTKALSKLGFNADIFLGYFDDNKYVQAMQEEFKEENSNIDSWRKPALTLEQFAKTLQADAKGIKAVLDRFRMSADQRKQLENKLKQ
jgi:hypothetical protein